MLPPNSSFDVLSLSSHLSAIAQPPSSEIMTPLHPTPFSVAPNPSLDVLSLSSHYSAIASLRTSHTPSHLMLQSPHPILSMTLSPPLPHSNPSLPPPSSVYHPVADVEVKDDATPVDRTELDELQRRRAELFLQRTEAELLVRQNTELMQAYQKALEKNQQDFLAAVTELYELDNRIAELLPQSDTEQSPSHTAESESQAPEDPDYSDIIAERNKIRAELYWDDDKDDDSNSSTSTGYEEYERSSWDQ